MVLHWPWRRWAGGIFLVLAAAMLLAGEFAIKEKLVGMAFVAYWLLCLLFTSLAIVVALRDLRSRRQQARAEHQELLKSTLEAVQQQVQERGKGRGRSNGR